MIFYINSPQFLSYGILLKCGAEGSFCGKPQCAASRETGGGGDGAFESQGSTAQPSVETVPSAVPMRHPIPQLEILSLLVMPGLLYFFWPCQLQALDPKV